MTTTSPIRVDWLVQRITGNYALADHELRHFFTKYASYRITEVRWDAFAERPEHTDADRNATREAHNALVDALEVLSVRISAPAGLRQRFEAWRINRRDRKRTKAQAASQ